MPQNANDVVLDTVRLWLDATLKQVVAESYLHGIDLASNVSVAERLTRGNSPLESLDDQYIRLTPEQAASLLSEYEVVDHHANDASGFSATLLRRKTGPQSGAYTLAIRSTEYKNPSQGGDFDRDGLIFRAIPRADGEIAFNGFATAQIAALEAYYQRLKQGITSTSPGNSAELNVAGAVNAAVREFFSSSANRFEVVGYSLGAHLATVFTERHESVVAQTYVFNAAGRGSLERTAPGRELARYEEMFSYFKTVLLNPDAAGLRVSQMPKAADNILYTSARRASAAIGMGVWNPFELTPANLSLDLSRRNVYADARYRWALYATKTKFAPEAVGTSVRGTDVTVDSGAFTKITQLFGHANFGDFEVTANSGVHAPTTSIFIEAQPFLEGAFGKLPFAPELTESLSGAGDFGNTHSLILIIDSLAVMEIFMTADANLTKRQVEAIFAGASNQRATQIAARTRDASVEGNSLEASLDALRKLYGAPGVRFEVSDEGERELRFDAGAEGWETPSDQTNGGFGNPANRRILHRHIELLKDKIAQKGAATVTSLIPENQFEVSNGEPLLDATARSLEFVQLQAMRRDEVGVAYRYALRELNPFVVTDNDSLYPPALQRELALHDPATGEGELSKQFVEDRAKLLVQKLTFGIHNRLFDRSESPVESELFQDLLMGERAALLASASYSTASTYKDAEDWIRLDRYLAAVDYAKRTIFGKDDALANYEDGLTGNRSVDRLYGGFGNDRLDGRGGDDFLDGGTGEDQLLGDIGDDTLLGGKDADVLRGGKGSDTYIWRRGDGFDTIIDFAGDGFGGDGLGKIESLGADLSGDKQLADPATNDKLFEDADYFYALTGEPGSAGTLTVVRKDGAAGGIRIEGFKNGDLGINLVGTPSFTKTDQSGTSDNDNITVVDTFRRFFGLGGNDRIVLSSIQAEGFGGLGDEFLSDGGGDQALRGEEGRDILLASVGADTLDGGLENDALQGGEGDDVLDGGDGDDVLDGGAGSDVLTGGLGHDFLVGGGSLAVASPWSPDAVPEFGAYVVAGQPTGLIGMAGFVVVEGDSGDVLDGGDGNDAIFAGSGEDYAEGGEGDDLVSGDADADVLIGGDGNDNLFGDGTQGSIAIGGQDFYTLPEFHGNDVLLGGMGGDSLQGDGGADELYGGEDNDVLIGDAALLDEAFHGADYIDGGDGNDVLIGYGKGDTLVGGAGEDNLGGDAGTIADSLHGDDYLDGDDGADTLHGDGGADTLFGGTGDDTLDGDASNVAFEFHGDDYLEGEDGNDALQGGGGSDRLFGGTGNDSLAGDGESIVVAFAGDDYLDGEAGNDVLDGGAGNDTLTGGAGVDMVMGGAGDDLYLVELGGQNDFIQDTEGANTVRMAAPVSFVFQTLGSDDKAYLGLRYSPSDIVHIQEGLTNTAIRTELADGTVRAAADWRASFNQFVFVGGTSGANTLTGSALAELFNPGGGNDTVVFGRGSGFDRVSGFGQVAGTLGLDKIQLGEGIAPSDLAVQRDINGHLTLTIKDSGDVLRIDNWGSQAAAAHDGIQVQFADGTGLTAADLIALTLAPTEGNDVLAGGGLDEAIVGGAGNDNLGGGAGADTLVGGEGDDTLAGGAGADTYVFGTGDGSDALSDTGVDLNVVQFAPELTPEDVTLTQGSIVVTLNRTGDTLTIADWYREEVDGAKFSVREMRFADGTVWDPSLINEQANHATPFGDLLRGIDADEVLFGLSGDDTIEGFSGDDVLAGGDGDDALDGGAGADDLDGGAGNDTLKGWANDDVLDGGLGDDVMDGGSGENVFFVGEGHDTVTATAEDSLVFRGVAAADVAVRRIGSVPLLEFASGSVRLIGDLVREVRFADGTTWSREELESKLPPVDVPDPGGGGTPPFPHPISDDTLEGTPDNDLLLGGFGNDTYVFGYGSGNDGIQEPFDTSPATYTQALAGERDRILFTSGVGPEDVVLQFDGVGDESIGLLGSNDTLTIRNAAGDTLARIEFAEFADGTVWDLGRLALQAFASPGGSARHFGTASNDNRTLGADDAVFFGLGGSDVLTDLSGHNRLYGDEANDSFSTGAGDDVLTGGAGNDSYSPRSGDNLIRFGRGAGQDTLTLARQPNDRGSDTVLFGEEVQPEDVRLRRGLNGTLIVELAGTPDSLTIADSLTGNRGRAHLHFKFADGTRWNAEQIQSLIQPEALIEGGTGANALVGGDGADLFVGGPGNDTLTGGPGEDRFLFLRGDGTDTIIDEAPRIVLGEGIAPHEVTLSPSSFAAGQRDLIIAIAGSGQITARNWFPSTHSGVIEFADGTLWDSAFIGTRVPFTWVSGTSGSYTGTSGSDSFSMGAMADVMRGEDGDDALSGEGGNDQLFGGAGGDSLAGGAGDDALHGEAGDDFLDGGAGNDGLAGGSADDILDAGDGDDGLGGGTGDDTLLGGAGRDLLEAGPGNDALDGGPGDDRLYGGSGSDLYRFGPGSGNDTLLDFDATGTAIDSVQMAAGVAPHDVEVVRSGADLVLRLASSGDQLTVRSYGRPGYGIEAVVFDDGAVWSASQLDGMATVASARERADVLFGSGGDDALAGLGGDDIIDGGAGPDFLDGGSGDDVLVGGQGDDTLVGGAGYDHLTGGTGADTFVVTIDSGSDAVADFGAGDTLTLGPGISHSGVTLSRDRDHLYLESRATGQFITLENWFAAGANGTVAFADGIEWAGVSLEASVNAITDGDDFLVGGDGDDTLSALGGLDTVLAGDGSDSVAGGEGSDALAGEAGDDTLAGEAGFDLLEGGEGNDGLDGGSDDDGLLGGGGNDVLLGGEGFDDLAGDAGEDSLFGGEGDDLLAGGEGADLLDGGPGEDALDGGPGNDIYVYTAGSGSDTITESGISVSTGDVLRLSGLASSEVGFHRFATHTVLEIAGSTDTVILTESKFPGSLVVERVEFDDGTVWDQTGIALQTINVGTEGDDMLAGFKGLVGLGGNDTLAGGPTDSLLDGGTGNDSLIGGAGNDTFVFGRGYGEDTVNAFDPNAGRVDVLAFATDVAPQDVERVDRLGNQLHLVLEGGIDRVRVENWFGSPDFRLSEARFADGTVWSADDIEARIILAPPTEGDDVLIGLSGDDVIDGLGGNDRLEGGAGNDTLIGNTGNDTLLGGSGSDVYVFGPDVGSDTVSDVDATPGNLDVIRLDAIPGEVTVTQLFPHLVLTLAGGERLTLLDWSSADAQKVEEVHFVDGTVWDVATLAALSVVPLVGTDGADFLQGTSGADVIDALGGNDLIFAGSGSDILFGGAADDTLNAESGNDVLDGGTGNDALNGGVGDDTYRFGSGYGMDRISELGGADVIEVDGLASDATARRAGNNLELHLASGDMLVCVGWFAGQQVELVRFADGAIWDVAAIDVLAYADLPHVGTVLAETLFGTNDADTLEGLAGNDQLDGRGGDDVLAGGSGSDSLFGRDGDDVYRFDAGDGADIIFEQSGFDVLEFGPGISPTDVSLVRSDVNVSLLLFGGADQVTFASWSNAGTGAFRVEEVRFHDGTVWDERFIFEAARPSEGSDFIRVLGAAGERIEARQGNDVALGGPGDDELLGGDGDDMLSGEAGADVLDGGPGRDLLEGGPGDDRFAFGPGYGSDWITDQGGLDEVVFGSGMTPSSVVFTRDLSSLFVTSGTDRLTVVDWFSHPDSRVESFRFSDGTVLGQSEVRSLIRPAAPTSLNDTIFGSDAGETIRGLLGEDALYGEGGNDTLDGEAGSDYMVGGAGDDSYHVDNRLDRVTEDPGEGVDTVFAASSYTLPANVENLTLAGVLAIDGTGNPLGNVIVGNSSANVVDGGAGNDSLRGGAGNDVYLVGRDEGTDEIIDFDPTVGNEDAVRLANDVAPSQVRVGRIDDDILLRVSGGGEVYLRSWFDPDHRIERVLFADGTIWDVAAIEFLSTVLPNRAPELSAAIPDASTLEDAPFELIVPAGTFVDPDAGDTLSYAAALGDGSALPGWLLFDSATPAFSAAPGNADVGVLEVVVTATDAFGETVSDAFLLEVQNVNDVPMANDDAGAAAEDGGPVTLSAEEILANDIDVDAGDTKAIIAASMSSAGAAVAVVEGELVYDIANLFQALGQDATASDAFAYTMADASGATSSAVVAMTIIGANDAPFIAGAFNDQVGREGELLAFAVPLANFADVDAGDALSFSAIVEGGGDLPPWLLFDSAVGTFVGAPAEGDADTYRIEVVAIDLSGARASAAFELSIEAAGGQGQTIVGTPEDDVLTGTPFEDFLDGREGSDRLSAGAGFDLLAYSEDARWNGHFRAKHAGSPGWAGTGDTESIAGKHRSYDIFDGGDGFDVLAGTGGHDALFLEDRLSPPNGYHGPRLIGIEHVATGEGHDLVDLTSQRFGYGDVILDGGAGNDVLWASAGNDLLMGGRGNDKLSGGAGEDAYLHEVHGGHDTIREAGSPEQLDVLRFSEGISRQMVRVERHYRDLVLDIAGPHGSVTIEGWFDSSAKRVERIEFADGSTWGEDDLRELARRSDGICDSVDGRERHDRDQHSDDDEGRRWKENRDDEDDRSARDFFTDDLAQRLSQRLAKLPDFDFGSFSQRVEHEADDAARIAAQWLAVARHARALADDAESEEGAAGSWPQRFSFARLSGLGSGAGFGFEGSIGAGRGLEDLKSFEGLTEGFRRL